MRALELLSAGANRLLGVFWIVTYVIFTIRGRLLDAPLDWISAKRLLAISIGTLFLALSMAIQNRVDRRRLPARLAVVFASSLAAAAALLVVRSLLDVFGGDRSGMADEVRWLLIWLGYFLAWQGIYVALTPQRSAEPAVVAQHLPPRAADDGEAIWAHRNQQRVRVPIGSIERVEAEGNYVRVYTSEGASLLRASMSQIEERLGTTDFVRTHRSAICRRSAIAAVERRPTGAYVATLASGAQVPVGRRFGQKILGELR